MRKQEGVTLVHRYKRKKGDKSKASVMKQRGNKKKWEKAKKNKKKNTAGQLLIQVVQASVGVFYAVWYWYILTIKKEQKTRSHFQPGDRNFPRKSCFHAAWDNSHQSVVRVYPRNISWGSSRDCSIWSDYSIWSLVLLFRKSPTPRPRDKGERNPMSSNIRKSHILTSTSVRSLNLRTNVANKTSVPGWYIPGA